MKEYITLIEENFEKYLKTDNEQLRESMLYSLNAGGKRIRPILVLEFSKMCGSDIENTLPYAIALEMIHTYSLIHDDLPCMDNDDFRRGKPTNHKVFGEALALLAGDALLNQAFEIMLDPENAKNFDSKNVLNAVFEVSKATGACGMIAGQVLDTSNEGKQVDIDILLKTHRQKTGELIKCASVCGTILGGGNQKDVENAKNFAINLGIAFQIRDDMLDVIGNTKILGKSIGNDNDKTTYTSLYSIEECEKLVLKYTNEAIKFANEFENNDIIIDLARQMITRQK